MIKSTLNWLDLISTEKKTSQTVTIDKDDCAFSVVYSLLKIKSKAYISENIFTIFKRQNKSRRQKSAGRRDTMILLFTSTIASAFAECQRKLERLEILTCFVLYFQNFKQISKFSNDLWKVSLWHLLHKLFNVDKGLRI